MTQDFGVVQPRDWGGQRVFIVGGGPSLSPHRSGLHKLNDQGRVLAVNDSYLHCKPDAIFSLDHVWLKKRMGEIPDMPAPVIVAVGTEHPRPVVRNLTYVRRGERSSPARISTRIETVTNLLNSGAGAINYATLRGATEIFLLGLDFSPGENNRSHYHDGYKWHDAPMSRRMYPRWASVLDEANKSLQEAGVRVWNCSPSKVLQAFKYRPYEEFLS